MGYLAGLIFIGIGIYAMYWGFNRIRFTEMTEKLRASYIQMITPGLVQVRGRVKDGSTLISPYSKTNCVYYKYSISKLASRANDDSAKLIWQEIGSGKQAVPFEIDDGTGIILINPAGAEIDVTGGRSFQSASGKTASLKERMEKLKEADSRTRESTGKKGFIRKFEDNEPLDIPDDLVEIESGPKKAKSGMGVIYNDVCIETGEEITVIGWAKPNTSGQAAFVIEKDENMPVFHISKSEAPEIQTKVKTAVRNSFLIGAAMIVMGIFIMIMV